MENVLLELARARLGLPALLAISLRWLRTNVFFLPFCHLFVLVGSTLQPSPEQTAEVTVAQRCPPPPPRTPFRP